MTSERPTVERSSTVASESTKYTTAPPTPLPGTPSAENALNLDEPQETIAPTPQVADGQATPTTLRGTRQRSSSTHSIPVGTLDPDGTAELTRKLTASSARQAAVARHEDAAKVEEGQPTFNPFDDKGNFDLELFLKHVFERSAAEKGSRPREMGVAFRNLSVVGVGSGVALSNSMSSLLLEPFRAIMNIRQMFNPPLRKILHDFTGFVRPGEMLLVLGRPGAGCTSFLKSVASYRDGFKSISGDISYEGFTHKTIDGTLRGDVCYVPEDDVHFATLNVGQTLEFAAATRAPQARRRIAIGGSGDSSRSDYINMVREVLGTILGLRHTFQTVVGNDLIRGVSGGERKRVSIAEILASRAKVFLFDNSSRGLDSSTALEFVRALRIATDVARATTIASIYQAGENIVKLFDKTCVIYDGHVVYFGPTDKAAAYFNELGFIPQDRQTTADFLVSVTDPFGRRVKPGCEKTVPRTAIEMAKAWNESALGRENAAATDTYLKELEGKASREAQREYKSLAAEEHAKHVAKDSKFLLSYPQQIRLAIKRRAQIVWGDSATQFTLAFASLFQALITGSVFYSMPANSNGFFSRGGVMFFAVLYNSFMALAEIPNGYAQRPIVIRQNRFAMLHPSTDALANTLLDMPIRIINVTIFDILLYFMTKLYYSPGAFFVFWSTTLLATYTMVAFFRALAATCRSEAFATMIGGLAVIDSALYAGYILIANEFRNLPQAACALLIPYGPDYTNVSSDYKVCPSAGSQPGQTFINGDRYIAQSYGYSWKNAGRNAGIIFGFWFAFLVWYCLASVYQKDPTASGGVIVFKRGKEPAAIKAAAKATGDDLEKNGEEEVIDEDALRQHDAETGALAATKIVAAKDVFAWRNVTYDVPIKKDTRRLLNNVSGYIRPGTMVALMGESGAGKTTLLNVLAQRTNVGVVGGDFTVSSRPLPRSFQADTGYAQQQDVHMAEATVREALIFSALLRQPAETPKQEKLDYVEAVIQMLEMESFANAMVGEVGAGLSVEQRKRLTIGVELAAKPELLLFLDEPTSGLDGQSAWSIIRFLRKLADAGQAILCTVHQPSGELFCSFDRLLLLKKGGETVYFGDIGPKAVNVIDYFSSRGDVKFSEGDNPAEFMLESIGAGATANTAYDWHKLYKESPMAQQLEKDLVTINEESKQREFRPEDEKRGARQYAVGTIAQLRLVLYRQMQFQHRNITYMAAKLGLNVLAGLFIGSSFWNQGQNLSVASLQNKLFAVFMALVISTSLAQQLQPVIINLRNLYEVRERPSKMYSWPVAVTAYLVGEIPWNVLGSTLFWAPWFWMIRFPGGQRAAYNWGLIQLFSLYWSTFATALAVISPNPLLASVLFSTFFSFVIVFCGVVQPPPNLPYFWRVWMFPLSPFTYLVESLVGNAVTGIPVRCTEQELNVLNPPPGQSCDTYLGGFSTSLETLNSGGAVNAVDSGYFQTLPNGQCGYCQFRDGDRFLASVSLDAKFRFRDVGILAAYIVFNLLLAYVLFFFFRIGFKNRKGPSVKVERSTATAPSSSSEGEEKRTADTDSSSDEAQTPRAEGPTHSKDIALAPVSAMGQQSAQEDTPDAKAKKGL
ncbi:ATP-binding cassette transporter snq2 [Tilletia horrida]|nr:ATP-binding cassette transporter snq2 [Tilletia horrida]